MVEDWNFNIYSRKVGSSQQWTVYLSLCQVLKWTGNRDWPPKTFGLQPYCKVPRDYTYDLVAISLESRVQSFLLASPVYTLKRLEHGVPK